MEHSLRPVGDSLTYESIDKLQNALAKDVFNYAKDSKKASGRALGTFVEIITFYLMESWGFSKHISIEKGLIEYGNDSIAHNVEYTLHPLKAHSTFTLTPLILPITAAKLTPFIPQTKEKQYTVKSNQLLSSNSILRNSCIVGQNGVYPLLATIDSMDSKSVSISISELYPKPFAMVECKRVGVEEGMKKGPQTIEKAKQGAYVAKAVSSLQKIRDSNGVLYGIISKPDGTFYAKPYVELINEIIHTKDRSLYKDFILTIGVVSNHGNWFTSDNPNKEMLVLAQAYDWLLFLTDKGICEFIDELLVNPTKKYAPIRETFLSSYQQKKNQFTKVQMQYETHLLLLEYFEENRQRIDGWFNVITPRGLTLSHLQKQLVLLARKDWGGTI